MGTAQAWIGHVGAAVLAAVLAGLLVRRRYRLWWFFALFLAVTLASTLMMAVWESRFYTKHFWQAKETALNLIRFAMALELAYRTFRAFPGALATLRWALLFVLVVTFVAVMAVTGPDSADDRDLLAEDRFLSYQSFLAELHPRVLNGSIWLFTAIAALILWYRLPVNPFHKAVLLSYVPYLLVFTVTMNVLGSLGRAGWERGRPARYLNQIAYLALMVHWTWVAWRRAQAPARSQHTGANLGERVSA